MENVSNVKDFAAMVKDELLKIYPDRDVTVREVTKNNGLVLTGITIFTKGCNISPTIYVDKMFEEYLRGASLDDLIKVFVQCYESADLHSNFDVSYVKDFDKAIDKICFKLVNAERNSELLKKVPHVMFNDLAVVFYILVENGDRDHGTATILVNNDIMNTWGIEYTNEFYENAKYNTQTLLPATVTDLTDAAKMLAEDDESFNLIEEMDVEASAPMYVASNISGVNGCSVMLYDGVLKEFSKKAGGDFYILPCSVHEVIFVPCNKYVDDDINVLFDTVKDINDNELQPDYFLSNHICKYICESETIEML